MSVRFSHLSFVLRGVLPLLGLMLTTDGLEGQRPIARTRLEPGRSVTVGQPLVIQIEVLVPSFFSGAPLYPDVELKDALVLFVYRGNNFTERINGVAWAGQRREYHVYPQRPGPFEIPAIPVGVRYKLPGGRAGETKVDTTSPRPIRFEATLPPGTEGLDYFISALSFRLQDTFDERPDTLLVGETFTRTITATVRGALSMVIPPLSVDTVPGFAAYPAPAEIEDIEGFGVEPMVGRRVESVTYVAQAEGDYRLPGVELQWWDVRAGRLRSATVPALQFHVLPNPAMAAEIPLPEDTTLAAGSAGQQGSSTLGNLARRWGPPLAGIIVIVIVAVRLLRRFGPRLRDRTRAARERRATSEAAYFRRFERAARTGEPKSTARALMSWLDRRSSGGVPTFAGLAAEADDAELGQELRRLEDRLYATDHEGATEVWSAAELRRRVRQTRKRSSRRRRKAQSTNLGGLNPGWGA